MIVGYILQIKKSILFFCKAGVCIYFIYIYSIIINAHTQYAHGAIYYMPSIDVDLLIIPYYHDTSRVLAIYAILHSGYKLLLYIK